MSIGIIIIGALGRMGREIAEIALTDDEFHLSGAVEYCDHSEIGKDYGICLGKGPINIPVSSSIADIQDERCVCIDFSTPNKFIHLPVIEQKHFPLIIGTTGLSDDEISFVENSITSKIPVLISPNMSLGINLLFHLTEMVSSRLKDDYDIEIIESHHRFKKDAPSGTAKRLGEIVASKLGYSYNSCITDGRKGISTSDRPKNEVGMHAIRGGDIAGDHTVLFAGIGERLELRHMAHSRSTFARGALIAAKWLFTQNTGLYSMRDMLGI